MCTSWPAEVIHYRRTKLEWEEQGGTKLTPGLIMGWVGPALGRRLQALEQHRRRCLEGLAEPAHRRRAGVTALRRQKPSAPHSHNRRLQLQRLERWRWRRIRRRATEQDKEEKDQQSWEGCSKCLLGSGRLHNAAVVRSVTLWEKLKENGGLNVIVCVVDDTSCSFWYDWD